MSIVVGPWKLVPIQFNDFTVHVIISRSTLLYQSKSGQDPISIQT